MSNQPRVPHELAVGDRIIFRPHDEADEKPGVITDVLSTQFVVRDDALQTYVTHFRNVRRMKS